MRHTDLHLTKKWVCALKRVTKGSLRRQWRYRCPSPHTSQWWYWKELYGGVDTAEPTVFPPLTNTYKLEHIILHQKVCNSDVKDSNPLNFVVLHLYVMHVCWYLAVAPVFGAPDESRDDLGHTALGALMRICNQTLHMRLQQRQEGIVKVPKKTLWQHKTLFMVQSVFVDFWLIDWVSVIELVDKQVQTSLKTLLINFYSL